MFSLLDLIGFMAIAALYTYGLILLIEILRRRVNAWSWTQVGARKGEKIVAHPSA